MVYMRAFTIVHLTTGVCLKSENVNHKLQLYLQLNACNLLKIYIYTQSDLQPTCKIICVLSARGAHDVRTTPTHFEKDDKL